MALWGTIFASLVVFTIGLLAIDLIPYQETMRCADFTNSTACPELFFSQSYSDARDRFLAAANKAGAEVEHHLVLSSGNQEYFIDTAFLKGSEPDHLLVHVSGTHGVEGYTGSAIQYHLLNNTNETMAQGPSILFIHGLNPFGMAHFRRFNENNVDLNRNYLSAEQWKEVLERDVNAGGYETLRHLLFPPNAPRLIDRYLFFVSAIQSLFRYGFTTLKTAFVTGQYHHPEGIYYGGKEEQKSVTLLRQILQKYSHSTKRSVFLDVHSGLGKFGVDTIMTSNTPNATLASTVFTGVKVQDDSKATSGASNGYHLAVGIIRPCDVLGPNCLSVTEEFGTVNPIFVARAVIFENAAYHLCRGTYVHTVMGTWVRDVFYPQEISYKKSVLEKGEKAFFLAKKYLS